jgi:2-keto-4-pentenoate hydratase
LNSERIEKIAQHLFAENRKRAKFEWLKDDLAPTSLEEAYAVQTRLHSIWESEGVGSIGGWKIAITSPAMQQLCGIDQPCVGGVLEKAIIAGPTRVRASNYVRLGLEFELAVVLGVDIEPSDKIFDASSAMEVTSVVAPAFELIEDRAADYSDFEALSLVADNTWNGGVVLGAELIGWKEIDWVNCPVCLSYNDVEEYATTGEAMGNPFNALASVLNNLNSRGLSAKQGQVVITGSTLKTRFATVGDRAQYSIGKLGAVSLTVEE